MEENWCALFVCIVKEKQISVDTALTLAKVHRRKTIHGKQSNPRKSKYSDEFVLNVLNLKNSGKSYKEIGDMFGLTRNQAWGIIKMYNRKTTARTPSKVVQAAN